MGLELKLLFTGDLSLTGIYRDRVERRTENFVASIREIIERHDFVIAYIEGPATAAQRYSNAGEYVVNPASCIPYLAARGIKVFNCGTSTSLIAGLEGSLKPPLPWKPQPANFSAPALTRCKQFSHYT